MLDDDLSRRNFLRGRLAGLTRRVSERAEATAPAGAARAPEPQGNAARPVAFPVHRPPGAVAEAQFLEYCTRCSDCIDACPHDALVLAPTRMRQAAGTPMLQPQQAPCRMCSDLPCIAACEPGVLRRDVPLRMSEVRVQEWACLAHQGSFCTVCSEQCPVPGAIRLADGKPHIEAACTGCGVCQYVCPAPTNALLIMPLQERPMAPDPSASSS